MNCWCAYPRAVIIIVITKHPDSGCNRRTNSWMTVVVVVAVQETCATEKNNCHWKIIFVFSSCKTFSHARNAIPCPDGERLPLHIHYSTALSLVFQLTICHHDMALAKKGCLQFLGYSSNFNSTPQTVRPWNQQATYKYMTVDGSDSGW